MLTLARAGWDSMGAASHALRHALVGAGASKGRLCWCYQGLPGAAWVESGARGHAPSQDPGGCLGMHNAGCLLHVNREGLLAPACMAWGLLILSRRPDSSCSLPHTWLQRP